MIKRLFLDEVYTQALKSEMNFNHGAIVTHRGRIVGKGHNKYCNSNFNEKTSLHAEVCAIKDALKKITEDDLKKCQLIVIRVNREGECLNSKPCCNCTRFINQFKIKKVFHS
jgi:tRNA(Arg) A34 adenosine deaminase TadA